MNDRGLLQRDDDRGKAPSQPARLVRHETPKTSSILDLQGRAGNRAVAALLGVQDAHATRAPVQRAPADPTPAAESTKEGKTSAAGKMTIPDLDLVVPILSFSQHVGGATPPKGPLGDAVVAISIESLDPRIYEAAAKGRPFASITIAIGPTSTFTLHDVVVSGLSLGSDTATVSLNFTSIEMGAGG